MLKNKTNYFDKAHTFSNVADILVVDPSENIVERMNVFHEKGVKAMLHLSNFFLNKKARAEIKADTFID